MSAEAVAVPVEIKKAEFVPLADRILVRRDKERDTLGSGILEAAEAFKEKQTLGSVLAIGPDVKGINVGDTVAFSVFAGINLPEDRFGKDMLVMAAAEAIGLVRQ